MFSYLPDFLPSSIVLIGAGGTGSRLMPMMAQLVRTCIKQHNSNAWLDKLPIYVIDGDTVEEKNLLRQNFITKDIGQPKASVVASRYGNAFGIDIFPSIEFIKDDKSEIKFLSLPTGQTNFSFNNSVVIMAVDSAEARRLILRKLVNKNHQSLTYASKCFIIDAGNEDAFGQVKFFTMNPALVSSLIDINIPNQFPVEEKVSFIPLDANYYLNLGSSKQELSCADLPQTLAINAMMATLICTVLQNFLYLKPMTFDGIRFSMSGAMVTEHNTPKRWLQRAEPMSMPISKKLGIYSQDSYITANSVDFARPGSSFNKILNNAINFYKKAGLVVDINGELIKDPAIAAKEEKERAEKARREAMKAAEDLAASLETARLKAVTDSVSVSVSAEGVPLLTRVDEGVEVEIPASIPALVQVNPAPPRARPRSRRAPAASLPAGVTEREPMPIQPDMPPSYLDTANF